MTAKLTFGEYLAAVVVAMMYSGGTFLERFAKGRARRETRDLLGRVPRTATRHQNGALDEVPLKAIIPGDRQLIRQGDVAPVDGTVASDSALMDQSVLTGEAMPVQLTQGDGVMSGATNAGGAFDLTATHPADQSTYAGIVRLVEVAQKSKATEDADVVPLVDRLDRLLAGMDIACRSRAIALQSVHAGIGLSFAGMIAAALGYLTPVQGALLQEVIDVAVILNALRVLRFVPQVSEAGWLPMAVIKADLNPDNDPVAVSTMP